MIHVYSTRDLPLLENLKQSLMEKGILCFTKNTNPTGLAMGEVPPIVVQPELWLHKAEDLEQAQTLIKELIQPHQASPWTCQQCHEELEGQYTSCWSCGTARPESAVAC